MGTNKILFLFDIDGTLLNAGKAAGLAFDEAFFEVYGIKDSCQRINKSGKTDLQILELVSNKVFERSFSDVEISTLNKVYSAKLLCHLQHAPPKVLSGVGSMLSELKTNSSVLLALQTGNIRSAAHAKLSCAGLWSFFPSGGFGDVEYSRTAIVKTAYETSRTIAFASIRQTYVIGDSPSDIIAAKENNFTSIAVASGSFTASKLSVYSPDYLLESLTEWQDVKDTIFAESKE